MSGAIEQARAAFRGARDAAMRGDRLADEGDLSGAFDAITAAICELEAANDALELEDGVERAQGRYRDQEAAVPT